MNIHLRKNLKNVKKLYFFIKKNETKILEY